MTDPLGNVTWNVYSASAPFTQETTLTINGTSAARDIITISDGLSRPIFIQTRQSPGSTAFDSVQNLLRLEHEPRRVYGFLSSLRRHSRTEFSHWHGVYHYAD